MSLSSGRAVPGIRRRYMPRAPISSRWSSRGTTPVGNCPWFPEGINGPDLVENIKKQAQNFGAEYLHGEVTEADLSRRPFRLNVNGDWIETRTLIIASGASARWLGLPNEQKLIGHGVSSCATCDGFFHRGKKIMVIGGGDSAMEIGRASV